MKGPQGADQAIVIARPLERGLKDRRARFEIGASPFGSNDSR